MDSRSIHEVSYRACFKPQLPHFFIERLTWPGDAVYDTFMGRGTTVLEAALLARRCRRPASTRWSPPRRFSTWFDYKTDNWLRCWFCGIDPASVQMTLLRRLEDWQAAMTRVFVELFRVVRPGGHVAFEVGEVRHGRLRLEEAALPCGRAAGFEPQLILINQQDFTKTANCWGVANGSKGTNTNRVVLFRRPE